MMENILTYAERYRDMDFSEKPLNVIDGLILSQLSYYDYSKSPFVMEEFRMSVSTFFRNTSEKVLCHMMTLDGDRVLFEALKKEGRHGKLRACRYVDLLDEENEKQFAAITFELGNDEYYIAFRGTDNTVLGWKEDFAMTYRTEVPAQKEALQYAINVMGEFSGNFYLGGHSKGGNLAVYAAACLPKPYQDRILEVHDYDGPGFQEKMYQREGYQRIRPLIRKLIPQSSFFGLLFEKDGYQVIHSEAKGIMQHDPYTWVLGEGAEGFAPEEAVDGFAEYTTRVFERWVEQYSVEERERLVTIGFEVIADLGIDEFYELVEETPAKVKQILESLGDMDAEEKKALFGAFRQLIEISASEWSSVAKEQRSEKKGSLRKMLDGVQKKLHNRE